MAQLDCHRTGDAAHVAVDRFDIGRLTDEVLFASFVSRMPEDQGASITNASKANPIMAKEGPQGVGDPVAWNTPQVAAKLAE